MPDQSPLQNINHSKYTTKKQVYYFNGKIKRTMNHFGHGVYETSQNMTMDENTSHIRGKILYTKGLFYQNKLE